MREAIAAWLGRRYPALAGHIDADTQVLPLNGSREGLFSAIFPALARKRVRQRAGGADPQSRSIRPMPPPRPPPAPNRCSLRATQPTQYLPALDTIDEALLQRTVALYLCSPSNPQGAVADRGYLANAIALARRFDFMLFADECYSEIYSDAPPPGALETAFAADGSFANVVAFNSLSKRSGLPGLRSGFVAGDPAFIAAFAPLPQRRLPANAAPDPACVGGGVGRQSPCRPGPSALSRKSRHGRRRAQGPLRL